MKKKMEKIPHIFVDVETLRHPFIDIAESYEQKLWMKGGFIMATDSSMSFNIGKNVLPMTIDYVTQVRTSLKKDMYEVTTGPKKSCTIEEWITEENKAFFETKCSAKELDDHLWNNLMPNSAFNNINYSNGNLKTLFPGKLSSLS